jgi:tetratricopeptide (TPR) repeat protein
MFGMSLERLKLENILEVIFFILLLSISFHTFVTSDFYFHLKTGEYIVTKGSIPFIDHFSYTKLGQPIIPYEWLDEALIYLIYSNFGFLGIGIYALFFLGLFVLIFRQILAEIFKVNFIARIILIGGYCLLTIPYWTERPQIIAYCCFILTLYLILKRVILNKNWLFLTIPIFLIWTNTHASMILGLALFSSYAVAALIKYLRGKKREDFKEFKDLAIFGSIAFVMTILPPLGLSVYGLLWKFFQNRRLISSFIDEWSPLTTELELALVYISIYLLAVLSFLFVLWRKKEVKEKEKLIFCFLPLLPISLFALSGERQAPFAFPALFLFFVPIFNSFQKKLPKLVPLVLAGILIAAFGFTSKSFYLINQTNYQLNQQFLLKKEGLEFIKNNLEGNMFNNFGDGGYLMDKLGPEKKVFMDGRTEMYLPEVMNDSKGFADYKYTSEEELLAYFNSVVDKYQISYAILPSTNFEIWRKLMHVLYNQPNWHLVYFDDSGDIFVKDDGKNDQTIKQYNMSAITPFQGTVYRNGQQDQALAQFQQMNSYSNSSVAANSIGYMLFAQKNLEEAKNYFIESIDYNPLSQTSITARGNLAEVYARQGDLNRAIDLYSRELQMDSAKGSAYVRLGELLIQTGHSKQDAIKVWQKGLENTQFDPATQNKLKQEIDNNQ